MATAARREIVDVPSLFGSTVADAERLLRKAKFCALFVRAGGKNADGFADVALFEVSKQTVRNNLRHMPSTSALPCELDLNDHRGAKLIFGGAGAIENAAGRPA